MLEEVLGSLNNWFIAKRCYGAFEVSGGAITLPEGWLLDGQYFRVIGSVFNDGLHQWPASDLKDEAFTGQVQALAVPAAVIDLAERIAQWQEKNGDKARGPYQSESFGGYSYSVATNSKGQAATWKDAFAAELGRWRKL